MTSVTAEIGTEEWCSAARSPNMLIPEMRTVPLCSATVN